MKTKKKIQKFQKRGFCLNIGRGAETRGKNRQLREIDTEKEIDRKREKQTEREREIDRKRNRQKKTEIKRE